MLLEFDKFCRYINNKTKTTIVYNNLLSLCFFLWYFKKTIYFFGNFIVKFPCSPHFISKYTYFFCCCSYTKVSGWVFVFGSHFFLEFFFIYTFSKVLCVKCVVLLDVWFHSCLCSSIKSVSFVWCKKNIIIIRISIIVMLLEIKHLSLAKHINKNFDFFHFWENNFKIC